MRGLMLPVLSLQILMISAAPLLQWLQSNQITPLQQQLLELQSMQKFYSMSQMGINTLINLRQPLLIILPDDQSITNKNLRSENQLEREEKEELKPKIKEEDDSVVIDAGPIPTVDDRKAIILLPSGRYLIGDFISAIPFLPIEINVPDTISWIGSGISGIISDIAQSFPFQRPSQNIMSNVGVKSNMNMRTTNFIKPLLMMPLSGLTAQNLPAQF